MNTSYPQARVIEAFDQLTDQLQQLAQTIRRSALPAWVPLTATEESSGISPRDRATQLYCDIWYQQGQDGRRTASRHGLIAADPAMLAAAEAVNRAKMEFQAAIGAIRHQPEAGWKEPLERRDSQLREDLNRKGLGRLHLKQCYRRIPLVTRQPKRIGFNWYTSGRSIRRITVADAQKALLRMGAEQAHIRIQLEQLGKLPPATPLAQVQQQAPLMRANLSYPGTTEETERQALNLSLPLLFPWDDTEAFPEHNRPDLQPPDTRSRQVRSDCRIEASPFLPSLRVHQYRGETS